MECSLEIHVIIFNTPANNYYMYIISNMYMYLYVLCHYMYLGGAHVGSYAALDYNSVYAEHMSTIMRAFHNIWHVVT